MNGPRIAIVGHGKMGRAVEQLARERDLAITATIDHAANHQSAAMNRERLGDADVVIEFTTGAAAPANILAAAHAGYAVVSGTTGWSTELPQVQQEIRAMNGTLLWSSRVTVVIWPGTPLMVTGP